MPRGGGWGIILTEGERGGEEEASFLPRLSQLSGSCYCCCLNSIGWAPASEGHIAASGPFLESCSSLHLRMAELALPWQTPSGRRGIILCHCPPTRYTARPGAAFAWLHLPRFLPAMRGLLAGRGPYWCHQAWGWCPSCPALFMLLSLIEALITLVGGTLSGPHWLKFLAGNRMAALSSGSLRFTIGVT